MLTLDERTHTYRLNDRVLPSITQIIKAVGIGHDFSNAAPIHSQRGRAVHKAVELVDNYDLDWDSVDSTVGLYLDHYLRFKKDTGFVPLFSELRLASSKDGYAGTLDKIGRIKGLGLGILELKCSESVDLEALKAQLSAQSRLWAYNRPGRKIKWKYGLQLSRKGPSLITKFSDVPDSYWMGLLARYKEAK